MKKDYKIPTIKVIKIKSNSLLYSSAQGGICVSSCRVWNICKNKNNGKWCDDKYKYE